MLERFAFNLKSLGDGIAGPGDAAMEPETLPLIARSCPQLSSVVLRGIAHTDAALAAMLRAAPNLLPHGLKSPMTGDLCLAAFAELHPGITTLTLPAAATKAGMLAAIAAYPDL